MMKFLTTALGGLTILTVTGLATAPGQAMLGMRQPQTAVPVSVIADPGPAKVTEPAAPMAPAVQPASTAPAAALPAVAPAARPVATGPAPTARPVARPAAPAAAAPASAANPLGGLGGAGAITNLLLNMPQVLQGGEGGPGGPAVGNNGGWVPPGQRGREYRKRHDGGDPNAGDYER